MNSHPMPPTSTTTTAIAPRAQIDPNGHRCGDPGVVSITVKTWSDPEFSETLFTLLTDRGETYSRTLKIGETERSVVAHYSRLGRIDADVF